MSVKNALMAFMMAMVFASIASAGVDYSTDIYGHYAPHIVKINPFTDKVSVTAPRGLTDSRVIFVDVFGRYKAQYAGQSFAPGETRIYSVPLSDAKGSVGVFTDYYNVVMKPIDGIPNIMSHNNDDNAMASVIAYNVGRHQDEAYVLGSNGVWGWIPDTDEPLKNAASAFLSSKEYVSLYAA